MASPVSAVPISDPMLALAELVVERDNQQAKLDDEELRAAHQEQRQELARQVAALHDAADDLRTGALVEAAVSVAGTAVSIYGTLDMPTGNQKPDLAREMKATVLTGKSIQDLAGPLGRVFGAAPEADDRARAKEADGRAADAGYRADQAQHHRDRVERMLDNELDTVESTLDSAAQGNLAVIANV